MSLESFDSFPFTARKKTRTVYTLGSGPGVVVMHEIPGITPEVHRFAERVADAGFTVFMPDLFGTPGREFSLPYVAGQMARACISREFSVLARNASSPIVDWLKPLCRHAHSQCGGPGVGAIGMCLTGNFALALMVDPAVLAPVLSQPSLPFPVSAAHKRALHVSDQDLARAKQRGCPLLGLRFTADPLCPDERFERLREEFGDLFEGVEIDSSKGNPHGIEAMAHSVVTKNLVDMEGHPTRQALDRVLGLFRSQLQS
jgi:dienelactone hydrolase